MTFNLTVMKHVKSIDKICVGLSRSSTFPDEQTQCSGVTQPGLLAGVCLEVKLAGVVPPDSGPPDAGTPADSTMDAKTTDAKTADTMPSDTMPVDIKKTDVKKTDVKVADATAVDSTPPAPNEAGTPLPASAMTDVWITSVLDGQVMLSQAVSGGGPHKGSVQINKDGQVEMVLGGLTHTPVTPLDTSLGTALVLIYGHGTSAQVSDLIVTSPAAANRCHAPATWLRHLMRGEPVIGADSNLASVGQPSVIKDPAGGGYLMAMVARGSPNKPGGIFIASSKTGREFTLEHKGEVKPVMEEGSAQFGFLLASPVLFHDGVEHHMWYSAVEAKGVGKRGIALATSKDGRAWTRYKGPKGDVVFVLPPNKDEKMWDSGSVKDPTVWRDTKTYLHMWYTGDVWYPGVLNTVPQPAIGYAVSKDGGKSWGRMGEVALSPSSGPAGEGTSTMAIEDPMVVYDETTKQFLMWYTYRTFGEPASIRLAVSLDRSAWHLWPHEVLGHGPPGTLDERGVASPAVVLDGARIRMWFGGLNTQGVGQIGYAENRGGL